TVRRVGNWDHTREHRLGEHEREDLEPGSHQSEGCSGIPATDLSHGWMNRRSSQPKFANELLQHCLFGTFAEYHQRPSFVLKPARRHRPHSIGEVLPLFEVTNGEDELLATPGVARLDCRDRVGEEPNIAGELTIVMELRRVQNNDLPSERVNRPSKQSHER